MAGRLAGTDQGGEALTNSGAPGISSDVSSFFRGVTLLIISAAIATAHHPPGPPLPKLDTQTLSLRFLPANEALRALKSAFPALDARVENDNVRVRGEHPQIAVARDLLERIDCPAGCPTKFVEISFADPIRVAEHLQVVRQFDTTFHAIAQPRTSRVFLMGTPAWIRVAEHWIDLLDQPGRPGSH